MYEVIWQRRALDQMDDFFVTQDDAVQKHLISVVRQMERDLARAPLEFGESRNATNRVAFFDMLFIRYSIDDSQRIVRIHRVRRYGR